MHQDRLPVPCRGLATAAELLDVFVYGTLKRGQSNHDRFCRGVLSVRPATTSGSLYDLPFGFPGLVVARDTVRAVGTSNYASDARRQREAGGVGPLAGGGVVHGELLTFDDPLERLPALDSLEGYAPGEASLYERVLLPVEVDDETHLAWTYALIRPAGTHLPDGLWQG